MTTTATDLNRQTANQSNDRLFAQQLRAGFWVIVASTVLTTAHARKGAEERCLQAGMDGYVAKPIDVARLFEVIRRLANAAQSTVAAAGAADAA